MARKKAAARSLRPAARPPPVRAPAPSLPRPLAWSAALSVPVLLYFGWATVVATRPGGVRVLFDSWDVSYYFRSAVWAVGPERLFVDVHAEYPLLANLLFAAVRLAASVVPSFPSPFDAFAWLWMSTSWLAYVAALWLVYARSGWAALLMWVAPATIFFSLLRFDVYPALACMLALGNFEKEKWVRGAAWFAVCIAFKGYALFLLPALVVFWLHHVGPRKAGELAILAVAPFLLGHVVVYAMAGMDGVLLPYRFHLERGVAIESSYGALLFVGAALGLPANAQDQLLQAFWGRLPLVLQTTSALAAAAFRPKSFDDLVHALLFAVMGVVTFQIFWSEQFILWIAAIACFSARWPVLLVTSVMCWITIVEFPVLFDVMIAAKDAGDRALMMTYRQAWRTVLAATWALRIVLMGLALPWRRAGRAP